MLVIGDNEEVFSCPL